MGRPLDWVVVAVSLLFLHFGRAPELDVIPRSDIPEVTSPMPHETPRLAREPATPRIETAQWDLSPAPLAQDPRFVAGGLPLLTAESGIGGDPKVWAAMLEDAGRADRRL
jgi:hypothetical protein